MEGSESLDGVLDRAKQAGVGRFVCVGTGADSSRQAIELACQSPTVWATVGLHPHDAKEGVESVTSILTSLGDSERSRVVGVGECGLDYYYEHSPRDLQKLAFEAQIDIAKELDLALVIHTRDAWDDTFEILESHGMPKRTVLHCFTGGPQEAKKLLDLGAWISFSGIVTFKNAGSVREAVALCPLDRLLVETDSPFLTPVPHRGKTNEPAWVSLVGKAVAEVKNMEASEVESATWTNTQEVFGLVGQ